MINRLLSSFSLFLILAACVAQDKPATEGPSLEQMRKAVVSVRVEGRRGHGASAAARTSEVTGVVVRASGITLIPAETLATGLTKANGLPLYFEASETNLVVTLTDGSKVGARLLGVDPRTSLASVQLNLGPGRESAFMPIRPPAKLVPNEPAMVVGARAAIPAVITGNTAAGVDAATRRFLPMFEVKLSKPASALSGAAVLDAKGQLIGLVRAQQAAPIGKVSAESPTAVWFALAGEMVDRVSEGLSKPPYVVSHPWIGLQVDNNPSQIEGARVVSISANGPAQMAMLRVGDVIVEVEGRRIRNSSEFAEVVFAQQVGLAVDVKFVRSGTRYSTKLTILSQVSTSGNFD